MDRVSSKSMPTVSQIETELGHQRYKKRYKEALRSTIFTLVTVSAIAVLVAVLLLPVLQIYGTSMSPTLAEGNVVVSVKEKKFKTGDVIAFYCNNRILVKRAIAMSGDWVDIDEDGSIFVNDKRIEEPYLVDRAKGECDIELPYQVPESHIFVMGDNRSVSIDSRSTTVGCIEQDQIVGKIIFRIWPFNKLGMIKTRSR